MKTKQLINFAFISGLLLAAGCSENETPEPVDNTPVELQVSPQVTLTRSVIDGGTQSGSDNMMQNIAVYAQSTTTNTAAKSNNYALYTQSGGSWTNNGTDKIFLSSEDATVYAYYPAYTPGTNGEYAATTPLKLSSDASGSSTIPLTVYEGGSGTASDYTITLRDNAEKTWQSSEWKDNSTVNATKLIAAAPGEVDYMWATSNPTQVDNGKGSDAKNASAALTMKHALALLSFRVYNDGTYKNTGALTQIKLANNSSGTTLSKSNGHTMNISTGAITNGTAQAATYTRTISSSSYTLITVADAASETAVAKTKSGDASYDPNVAAAAASKKVSMLVLPAATVAANSVKATFTIDGADYSVDLSQPAKVSENNPWEQGKNYLYTVKLSGSALTISSVTVTDWTEEKITGDLEIK
ncbi:fimbrillin family protein [Bacteroides timonensis]|uniref:fimbrillin family protein n=1 Tax=Bacteroides timonensis TaxID=1470345 RepID=UPI0004B5AD4A|nr:fimbrillin family protein [Bacteroides timonensis]